MSTDYSPPKDYPFIYLLIILIIQLLFINNFITFPLPIHPQIIRKLISGNLPIKLKYTYLSLICYMKKKSEAGVYGSSPVRNQDTKTLKQQFIYELLGQEEAFKKFKTKQNLTKLIMLYRKLVEYYSQKGDKIQLYFADKIANVSSEMPNLQETDERLTMSMVKETADDDKNASDSRFKTIITSPVLYDPEIKKKERSKNAQIAIEVNKVKKRANARTILKSYYEQWEENNKIIMSDLKNQRKQLEDKLLAIHKRSEDAATKPIII